MLRVFRQLHESVIHVQLHVTVKQRQTGINFRQSSCESPVQSSRSADLDKSPGNSGGSFVRQRANLPERARNET